MDLTQNELDQLRTAMNTELDRLIAARKPEVKQFPSENDKYFHTWGDGDIDYTNWHNDRPDRKRLSVGNAFKTRAEAERRVEALKVHAELRRMPGVVSWERGVIKFAIQPDSKCTDDFTVVQGTFWCPCAVACGVFFESEKAAAHALHTIGQERLQIWLDDYLQTPIGG